MVPVGDASCSQRSASAHARVCLRSACVGLTSVVADGDAALDVRAVGRELRYARQGVDDVGAARGRAQRLPRSWMRAQRQKQHSGSSSKDRDARHRRVCPPEREVGCCAVALRREERSKSFFFFVCSDRFKLRS
jgi:hypothetical protein